MSKRIELEGKYFGKLYVVEYVGKGKYLCRCECGNEKIISGGHLRGGATKSCGCLARELTRKRWAEDDTFRQKQKEAASKASKQMWEDDNFRETMSEKLKDKWDDNRRQKQSELMKIKREEWGKNQNYIDMQSKKMKNKWEDENYRERQSELSRKRMEEMWEREDFRQMHHEMRGNKHPRYNPNKTDEERIAGRKYIEHREWSKLIKENANYTCDYCGKRGGNLHTHHLDGHNWCKERRTDITNGVCLCEECHKKFHDTYGYGDNTEAQYIEFKQQEQQNNN